MSFFKKTFKEFVRSAHSRHSISSPSGRLDESKTIELHSDEHKLSAGAAVLAVIMAIFLLIVSERALSDLENSVPRPEEQYPYSCLHDLEYFAPYEQPQYDYYSPIPYKETTPQFSAICEEIFVMQK